MEVKNYPYLHLPDWLDERAEFEIPFKGYLSHVQVELADGSRYEVVFIDPVRLRQDLEEEVKLGRPYFAEVGVVVLPEVTLNNARTAVKSLSEEGFFAKLKPL